MDLLLDSAIRWLSAIGTMFCGYKSIVALWILQERSEWYSLNVPLGLTGAVVVFLAGTAVCATVGLWCEIHRLRMDRKEARTR